MAKKKRRGRKVPWEKRSKRRRHKANDIKIQMMRRNAVKAVLSQNPIILMTPPIANE